MSFPVPLPDRSPFEAPTIAELKAVGVSFDGQHALRDVDLRITSGRLVVLVGPNGAGKSTLIELLAGARPPTRGRVSCEASSVAFVPQRAAVPDRLPITVQEVVTIGAWGESGPWRRVGRDGRDRVRDAIQLLGLTSLARRSFSTLSGGERQRTLLAQGLARGAGLLLVDEPTTGLDVDSTAHICAAIAREVSAGTAVVCVSHDERLIGQADRVVRLEKGFVVADSDPC